MVDFSEYHFALALPMCQNFNLTDFNCETITITIKVLKKTDANRRRAGGHQTAKLNNICIA